MQSNEYDGFIRRHIKFISPDVIELTRSTVLGVRFVMLILLICTLGLYVQKIMQANSSITTMIDKLINPSQYIQMEYEQYLKERTSEHGDFLPNSSKEFEQFSAIYQSKISEQRVLAIIPLVMILVCLLIPNSYPVRFDRKRRLIYVWHWGKFYIYRYQALKSKEELMSAIPLIDFGENKPFRLCLPDENNKSFWIKPIVSRFLRLDPKNALPDFLSDYLISTSPILYYKYANKKLGWFYGLLSLSFFNRKFNEQKTNERIQSWLKQSSREAISPTQDKDMNIQKTVHSVGESKAEVSSNISGLITTLLVLWALVKLIALLRQ